MKFPMKLECKGSPKSALNRFDMPDPKAVSDLVRQVFDVPLLGIDLHVHGALILNMVYKLNLGRKDEFNDIPEVVLLRVSLNEKCTSDLSLESEVATMLFVKKNTTIPVPTVYAYCVNTENTVGRPFIVMSLPPGSYLLGPQCSKLGIQAKLRAVHDYASIVAQLFQLKFDCIGSLQLVGREQNENDGNEFQHSFEIGIGPISRGKRCADLRRKFKVYDLGPWKNAGDWITASLKDDLQFMVEDPENCKTLGGQVAIEKCDDALEEAGHIIPNLLSCVTFATDDAWSQGPFFLAHNNLSQENILVEPSGPNAGAITGILDWDMASTVPLWSLICPPKWFDRLSCPRGGGDSELFREAYAEAIDQLFQDENTVGVAKDEAWRRDFAHLAMLSWAECAYGGKEWVEENEERLIGYK